MPKIDDFDEILIIGQKLFQYSIVFSANEGFAISVQKRFFWVNEVFVSGIFRCSYQVKHLQNVQKMLETVENWKTWEASKNFLEKNIKFLFLISYRTVFVST